MAKNKRKTYEEAVGIDVNAADGLPCAECGCRHSYVVKTERIGDIVRRRRQCRFCGHAFYTTESV